MYQVVKRDGQIAEFDIHKIGSAIQKAFEALTRNKTVLMIAHRLSTVQDADNIIVLSDGKIAEQGNHRDLLQKNGVYAAMWADYQRSAQWKVGKEAAV